jgi:hypothetical protein
MNQVLMVALYAVVALGCSHNTKRDDAGVPDVVASWSGKWAGSVDDEGVYLELTQDGGKVVGVACERPDDDCNQLTGTVTGDALHAEYTWDERGTRQVVAFDLKLSSDGASGVGTFTSTKCDGCKLVANVRRLTP